MRAATLAEPVVQYRPVPLDQIDPDVAAALPSAPQAAYDADLDGVRVATVYRVLLPDPLLSADKVTRWVAIGPGAHPTWPHTRRGPALATYLTRARGFTAVAARRAIGGRS